MGTGNETFTMLHSTYFNVGNFVNLSLKIQLSRSHQITVITEEGIALLFQDFYNIKPPKQNTSFSLNGFYLYKHTE